MMTGPKPRVFLSETACSMACTDLSPWQGLLVTRMPAGTFCTDRFGALRSSTLPHEWQPYRSDCMCYLFQLSDVGLGHIVAEQKRRLPLWQPRERQTGCTTTTGCSPLHLQTDLMRCCGDCRLLSMVVLWLSPDYIPSWSRLDSG